jgi:hypothetical protein
VIQKETELLIDMQDTPQFCMYLDANENNCIFDFGLSFDFDASGECLSVVQGW